MIRKIKILIVSNTPWDNNNSFGNSFSNIFENIENIEIANIYCQPGAPKTNVAQYFFQITENFIIKKILKKRKDSGQEVFTESQSQADNRTIVSENIINNCKRKRWQIMFWVRDLIWATKAWKSEALKNFILEFNPDIIFQPIYYSSYINEIALYAKELTGKPMVGYQSDDCVTFKHFSLSPFFWIDRFIKIPMVRKVMNKCELIYTITEKQRKEYTEIFGKEKCKILYKGGDFKKEPIYQPNEILQFIYTGNIGAGRWKTLAMIASALESINADGLKAQLHIYSASPISSKIHSALNKGESCIFEGKVDFSKIKLIQQNSDVLVHVESFELSERYKARLSFSTKIVDYLESGRCILAIGWKNTGAIEALSNGDAAICVTKPNQILPVLRQLITEKNKIIQYSHKAFKYGFKYHQKEKIKLGLINDLQSFLK